MSRFRLTAPKIILSENDVEKACIDLLHARGYWVGRQHVGRFQTFAGGTVTIGQPGLPDYYAIHPDRPGCMVEVKRPGETLRPSQERKILELRQGWRLQVAVIDRVEALAEWLAAKKEERS